MSYFSKIIYTADGVTKTYSIPFSYISTSYVKVYVDGVEKFLTTDFTFLNSYTIELNVCPLAGSLVTVKRSTKKDERLVQFQNASLLDEVAQNKSAEQGLDVLQETLDATETAIIEDVQGNLDAKNRRIVNVSTPINPNDAATKAYTDTPISNAQNYVDEEIIPVLDEYIVDGLNILNETEQAAVLAAGAEQHATEAEASADAAATSASEALASEQNAEQWAEVFTGGVNMIGAINEATGTIAAHATTCDIWSKPNNITLTGDVVTFTDLADAPQAGAARWIKSNAAHVLTNNANLIVQSGANVTLAAGDWFRVEAITVDTFNILIFRADGKSVVVDAPVIPASGGVKIGAIFPGGIAMFTVGANDLHAGRFKAPISTEITRLGIQLANATNTQPIVLGIYADSSNEPGAKLGQTSPYALVVPGDNYQEIYLDLQSPVDIVAGTNYWLAIHSNYSIDVERYASRLNRNKFRSIAYSATLPDPFGTPTSDSPGVMAMVGC